MKSGLAIVLWVIVAVVAVANGYFGNTVVAGQLGDYGAHVYKTVVVILAVFLMAWIYARQTRGAEWAGEALAVGILWLGLTIVFEFVFGHYVLHNPWETLIADYRIWKGRLWSLVLLSELFAPLLVGWRLNR
jgi:uncharacterized membrane protein YgdD (TMEM256/DUF423 family)